MTSFLQRNLSSGFSRTIEPLNLFVLTSGNSFQASHISKNKGLLHAELKESLIRHNNISLGTPCSHCLSLTGMLFVCNHDDPAWWQTEHGCVSSCCRGAGERFHPSQRGRLFCLHLFYLVYNRSNLPFSFLDPQHRNVLFVLLQKSGWHKHHFLATAHVTLILERSQCGDCDIFHCCVCRIRGSHSGQRKHAIASVLSVMESSTLL